MTFQRTLFLTLAAVFSLSLPLASARAFDLHARVSTFRLDNGMLWIVARRPQAPVFSGVVMVRVGSLEEETGKTGLAHMFEHMAFKGSRQLGTRDFAQEQPLLKQINALGREITALQQDHSAAARERVAQLRSEMSALEAQAATYRVHNEVWELLTTNGADDLNAFTTKDITAFHASMPINRLSLWGATLSQMIGDPILREFYTERDVVAEERRLSVDNNPDGRLAEALLSASYKNGPYSWSTIGLEQDIHRLTDEDAEAFHRRHYVGANMVGVIVGDVTTSQVRRMAQRYFSFLPAGSPAPTPAPSEEVQGIKRTISADARSSVAMAFHKPTLPDPAEYAFDVITALLCDGPSSRLERALVSGHLARSVSCTDGYPGGRLPNLLVLWIEPLQQSDIRRIYAVVDREIEKLRTQLVPMDELQKVQRKSLASLVFSLQENMELATALARFQTVYGNWKLLADYPRQLEKVTAEQVQSVAQHYLQPHQMIVVERLSRGGKR